MNNAVIIQHVYPGLGFEKMMELTRTHNVSYCNFHKFDYQTHCYANELDVNNGGWVKIELIRAALKAGYEYIVWLDADAMIIDVSVDLRHAFEAGKIGAAWHRIPQLNHWNVGVMYVHNTPDTSAFISQWLASYPPPKDGWMEQGVFNRMGKAGKIVSTVSDKWNATIDVNLVPDAVVLGFHGQGDAEYRYGMMEETFKRLFK